MATAASQRRTSGRRTICTFSRYRLIRLFARPALAYRLTFGGRA